MQIGNCQVSVVNIVMQQISGGSGLLCGKVIIPFSCSLSPTRWRRNIFQIILEDPAPNLYIEVLTTSSGNVRLSPKQLHPVIYAKHTDQWSES